MESGVIKVYVDAVFIRPFVDGENGSNTHEDPPPSNTRKILPSLSSRQSVVGDPLTKIKSSPRSDLSAPNRAFQYLSPVFLHGRYGRLFALQKDA